MHQAIACAEAKVTLISPFVGRILDWYKKATGRDELRARRGSGRRQSVTKIYNYYKKYGHKTEVMGASFRNIGEIIELAGCDLLTIAPSFLAELESRRRATLARKLDPAKARQDGHPDASPWTRRCSARCTTKDRMAKDKLDEGIEGFSKAIVALEKLLAERYKVLLGKGKAGKAAREFFGVYDLDGDGFITREEWGGTDAVFDALDVDGDGRLSAEEMAAGLGAAFVLR